MLCCHCLCHENEHQFVEDILEISPISYSLLNGNCPGPGQKQSGLNKGSHQNKPWKVMNFSREQRWVSHSSASLSGVQKEGRHSDRTAAVVGKWPTSATLPIVPQCGKSHLAGGFQEWPEHIFPEHREPLRIASIPAGLTDMWKTLLYVYFQKQTPGKCSLPCIKSPLITCKWEQFTASVMLGVAGLRIKNQGLLIHSNPEQNSNLIWREDDFMMRTIRYWSSFPTGKFSWEVVGNTQQPIPCSVLSQRWDWRHLEALPPWLILC